MRIYDDGWYRIPAIKFKTVVNCHYFFKDKPIHSIGTTQGKTVITRKFIKISEQRRCKSCLIILQTYSKIGLENRCI